MAFSCVFILVQLNKCVVCGSDFQMGHSGDRCLSSSILFKYESSTGNLVVLGWARVRRVALAVCLYYHLFRHLSFSRMVGTSLLKAMV